MSAWARALERANARLVTRLRRAMRREYQVVAAEFTARSWSVELHRARVTHVLRLHYARTFRLFARLGRQMLDGREPAQRSSDEPDRATRAEVVAVLSAVLAHSVADDQFGPALDALVSQPEVVQAVQEAWAAEPSIAGAAALAQRNPLIVHAVAAAIVLAQTNPAGDGDDAYRETVAQFVEEHAPQRAAKIAEGTRQAITRAIADAARDGVFDERTVGERVTQALTGMAAASWRGRRIARTEIGAAMNAALIATAEASGRPYMKTWITVGDDHVRPTHEALDGQKMAQGESFTVGGFQMQHPGDLSGPPQEVINCRCTLLLETLE